jgi:hypothetical protein
MDEEKEIEVYESLLGRDFIEINFASITLTPST